MEVQLNKGVSCLEIFPVYFFQLRSFREKGFGRHGWSIGFTEIIHLEYLLCVSLGTQMKDLRLFYPDGHTKLSLNWGCGFFLVV